jgi:uncharacterized protein involved in type VI secretion and phage assembly
MSLYGGVLRAIVLDNHDPDGLGRVKVRLAQAGAPGQPAAEAWAPISDFIPRHVLDTGFLPDVQDEVLVAFERGDPRRPYVIGSLRSSPDSPPQTREPTNAKTVLRSRGGVEITLDDKDGQQSFIVETPGGQKLTLKDGSGSVELLDSNGNSVTLGVSGIVVKAASTVTINASQAEINAATVNVNAGMSKFSGVVQCDTLISNSVVSASYSPGTGNVS